MSLYGQLQDDIARAKAAGDGELVSRLEALKGRAAQATQELDSDDREFFDEQASMGVGDVLSGIVNPLRVAANTALGGVHNIGEFVTGGDEYVRTSGLADFLDPTKDAFRTARGDAAGYTEAVRRDYGGTSGALGFIGGDRRSASWWEKMYSNEANQDYRWNFRPLAQWADRLNPAGMASQLATGKGLAERLADAAGITETDFSQGGYSEALRGVDDYSEQTLGDPTMWIGLGSGLRAAQRGRAISGWAARQLASRGQKQVARAVARTAGPRAGFVKSMLGFETPHDYFTKGRLFNRNPLLNIYGKGSDLLTPAPRFGDNLPVKPFEDYTTPDPLTPARYGEDVQFTIAERMFPEETVGIRRGSPAIAGDSTAGRLLGMSGAATPAGAPAELDYLRESVRNWNDLSQSDQLNLMREISRRRTAGATQAADGLSREGVSGRLLSGPAPAVPEEQDIEGLYRAAKRLMERSSPVVDEPVAPAARTVTPSDVIAPKAKAKVKVKVRSKKPKSEPATGMLHYVGDEPARAAAVADEVVETADDTARSAQLYQDMTAAEAKYEALLDAAGADDPATVKARYAFESAKALFDGVDEAGEAVETVADIPVAQARYDSAIGKLTEAIDTLEESDPMIDELRRAAVIASEELEVAKRAGGEAVEAATATGKYDPISFGSTDEADSWYEKVEKLAGFLRKNNTPEVVEDAIQSFADDAVSGRVKPEILASDSGIRTALKRRAVDLVRKETSGVRRGARSLSADIADAGDDVGTMADTIASGRATPEAAMRQTLSSEALEVGLGALDDQERMAYMLKGNRGLNNIEIAEKLGLKGKDNTVARKVARLLDNANTKMRDAILEAGLTDAEGRAFSKTADLGDEFTRKQFADSILKSKNVKDVKFSGDTAEVTLTGGQKVSVRFTDEIVSDGDGGFIRGAITATADGVTIDLNRAANADTFDHELVHLARHIGAISDGDWAALVAKYGDEEKVADALAAGNEMGLLARVKDFFGDLYSRASEFVTGRPTAGGARRRFREGSVFDRMRGTAGQGTMGARSTSADPFVSDIPDWIRGSEHVASASEELGVPLVDRLKGMVDNLRGEFTKDWKGALGKAYDDYLREYIDDDQAALKKVFRSAFDRAVESGLVKDWMASADPSQLIGKIPNLVGRLGKVFDGEIALKVLDESTGKFREVLSKRNFTESVMKPLTDHLTKHYGKNVPAKVARELMAAADDYAVAVRGVGEYDDMAAIINAAEDAGNVISPRDLDRLSKLQEFGLTDGMSAEDARGVLDEWSKSFLGFVEEGGSPFGSDIEHARNIISSVEAGSHADAIKASLAAQQEISAAALDYAHAKGLISDKQYGFFKAKGDYYTPLQRVMERAEYRGQGSVFERFKGSAKRIRNPITQVHENFARIVQAADGNDALRQMTMLDDRDTISKVMAQLESSGLGIREELVRASLKRNGWDGARALKEIANDAAIGRGLKGEGAVKFVDDVIADYDDTRLLGDIFDYGGTSGQSGVRKVIVDGEARNVRMLDEKAAKQLDRVFSSPEGNEMIEAVGTAYARALRWSVSHDPFFSIRNRIRDMASLPALSKSDAGVMDLFKGVPKEEVDELLDMMNNAGGIIGGWQHTRPGRRYAKAVERSIRKMSGDKNVILTTWDKIRDIGGKGLDKIEGLTEKSETATRMIEFRESMKKLKQMYPDASEADLAIMAAGNSNDLMDFNRMGTIARSFNKYVPFLAPRIQGTLNAGKSFLRNPKRATSYTLGALGGAGVANYAMAKAFGRGDEYEQLPAYRRDFFWNLPLPGGYWAAIPKPFEFGVAGSFVERIVDRGRGFEGYGGSVMDALAPIGTPDIAGPAKPLLEVLGNRDYFRDRQIVPPWEEKLDVSLRSGAKRASYLGKALHSVFGFGALDDPRKFDHLIGSIFAGYGRAALDLTGQGERTIGQRLTRQTGMIKTQAPYGLASVQGYTDEIERLGQHRDKHYKNFRKLLSGYYNTEDSEQRTQKLRSIIGVSKYGRDRLRSIGDKLLKAEQLKRAAEGR